MPRKTLALISGLILVTVILFVIALKSSDTNNTTITPTPVPQIQSQVSPTVPAHSVLSLSPNPVTVEAGKQGKIAVNIDTSDNEVTAIQLEVAYDPNFVTNVKIIPEALFQNPVLLINKNDSKEGRYTYAYGIMPNRPTIRGGGTVATITFTAVKSGTSQLALLPTTLVTARGISESVLKSASGTLVEIVPSQVDVSE